MAKGLEEKLAFPKQQARLHELAQRKSRLLTVQNGSRRGTDVSRAVTLHEGSLRTLWADKAKRHVEAKQVWKLGVKGPIRLSNFHCTSQLAHRPAQQAAGHRSCQGSPLLTVILLSDSCVHPDI